MPNDPTCPPAPPRTRRGTPSYSKLLAWIAGIMLLLNGVMQISGHPTTLFYDAWFLLRPFNHHGDDSWGPMYVAWRNFAVYHDSFYQRVFFDGHIKFQYPPSALLPMAMLDGVSYERSLLWFNALNWALVWLTCALTFTLLLRAERLAANAPLDAASRRYAALLAIVCTFGFYPLLKAWDLGQVQVPIDAAFALALLCYLGGRDAAAGALIGLICLLKPQFSLFLPWAALRRRWHFALGLVGVLGMGTLWALLRFGPGSYFDYLAVLASIAHHGETFFANQSMNGVLNRLLDNGDSLRFDRFGFAPYHPWVYGIGTMATITFILVGLWWRGPGPHDAIARGMDLGIAALAFTLAAPVAWEHHYGVMLAMFTLALVWIRRHPVGPALALALGASWLLSSLLIDAANRAAHTVWGLGQALLFLGALILLAVLYRMRAAAERTGRIVRAPVAPGAEADTRAAHSCPEKSHA